MGTDNTFEAMEIGEFMKKKQQELQGPYTANIGVHLMSTKEYSELTGQTVQAITGQLRKGRLDGVRNGKRWFVKVEDDTAVKESEELKSLRAENVKLKTQLEMIKVALFGQIQEVQR